MDFKKATDEELIQEAQTGFRGQGAVVESMVRLRNSIERLNRTTSNYSIALIILTLLLFITALIQIYEMFKN